MSVYVKNLTTARINKTKCRKLCRKVLELVGQKNSELDILFVGTRKMKALNLRYRRVPHPTDVLAFSMREGRALGNPDLIGDIVICPQVAKANAKRFKTSWKQEVRLYLIHGILHCLGWNDSTPSSRRRINTRQQQILDQVKKIGL